MNDDEVDLRRIVERIVRPIAAAEFRKQRMREELLAHVHAVYQQQLQLNSDHQRAIEETRKRLGDSKELSDSLQDTVPSFDSFWMFFQGKAPSTVFDAGLRFVGVLNLVYFTFLIPIVCFSLANSSDVLQLVNSPLILPFLLLMPAWSTAIALMMWIMDRMQTRPANAWPPKNPRQLVTEIWSNLLLKSAAIVCAVASFVAILRVQRGSLDLVCITMQLLSVLALGVLVAWSLTQDVYEKRRRTEVWSSLVID